MTESEGLSLKAEELVEFASDKKITFGFAESLTGGMISSSVVNVPGASAVFKGSVVSYTNEIKERVLGVPAGIIDANTEVSEECAVAMAEGAKDILGVDLAVSVTGIAGPTGALPGKPVGTVFVGYSYSGTNVDGCISGSYRMDLGGGRELIRTTTALAALNTAITLIMEGRE